jgi:hypothetical protein
MVGSLGLGFGLGPDRIVSDCQRRLSACRAGTRVPDDQVVDLQPPCARGPHAQPADGERPDG